MTEQLCRLENIKVAPFPLGTRVEVRWGDNWFPGTVSAIPVGLVVSVEFDAPAGFGGGEVHLIKSEYLRLAERNDDERVLEPILR